MKTLDFMIIGAQKCATTTLFELLRQHPDVSMPLEKEVPLFTNPKVDHDALANFAASHLDAREGQLCGKVTPQYMADSAVPARIAALLPQCKLIAVLRDPIERARSHYRMGQRRGTESRNFDTAMAELLTPQRLGSARTGPVPTHSEGYESESDYYLAWSEYGRILAGYRQHFPAAQMLVIYSEELATDPRGVLDRVLRFLDLSHDFSPTGLGEVMHAGGGSNKIPHALRLWLREQSLVSAIWQRVPAQQQGRLRFLYERWNTRKQAVDLPLPEVLDAALRQHFAEDLAQLSRLGLPQPPWHGAYPRSRGSDAVTRRGTGSGSANSLSAIA
jgi:hypothetical protein